MGQAEAGRERASLDPGLPEPDAGFFGRDETLLALDRAFDTHRVVLLHAYAGEREDHHRGGVRALVRPDRRGRGPVLLTWFERRTAAGPALDQVGGCSAAPGETGWTGPTLDDEERRRVALQILAQVPVLWIWDNVEPVAGFPAGTASRWTPEEQGNWWSSCARARGTRRSSC